MFNEHPEFYLQKCESMKRNGLVYIIKSNNELIGKVQETKDSPKKIKKIGLKLISMLFLTGTKRIIIENLELKLLDNKEQLLGTIKKGSGFYKDLLLYSEKGQHLATISSKVKTNSPSITVTDANGYKLIIATGNFGATNVSVYNCKSTKQISSIRKRSLIYSSIKDNLLNNDVYYIQNNQLEAIVTFALIGVGVALDLDFHAGH